MFHIVYTIRYKIKKIMAINYIYSFIIQSGWGYDQNNNVFYVYNGIKVFNSVVEKGYLPM